MLILPQISLPCLCIIEIGQGRGIFHTKSFPVLLLISFSMIWATTDLMYSFSLRNCACSPSSSAWSGVCLHCCAHTECSANASVNLSCIWIRSVFVCRPAVVQVHIVEVINFMSFTAWTAISLLAVASLVFSRSSDQALSFWRFYAVLFSSLCRWKKSIPSDSSSTLITLTKVNCSLFVANLRLATYLNMCLLISIRARRWTLWAMASGDQLVIRSLVIGS